MDKLATLFARLTWPQVVAILVLGALTVALVVLLPDGRWGDVLTLLATVLGVGGMAGTAALAPKSDDDEPPTPPPPPPNRRAGFAAVDLLLWVVVVAGVLTASLLHGCGATAAQREGYAAEMARCIAAERAIVDRTGTTADEDREALELERARCDAALSATYGGAE